MTPSQIAYAEYHRLKVEFEACGIPWNQKGSPHRIWLAAKRELAKVSVADVVDLTIKSHAPQLIANIYQSNALLRRFMR
jgi:hypothetical protein